MNINKLYSTLILSIITISGIYGYYRYISAMKGEGAVSSMSEALAYVESQWQDGDIIYMTDDGPWINVTPYTSRPVYRMPECSEPVRGSLSGATRAALGMQITPLDSIPYNRAWVFAPFSPLHPPCYYEQIAPMTAADPVYIVDRGDWLYSAVWLVTK